MESAGRSCSRGGRMCSPHARTPDPLSLPRTVRRHSLLLLPMFAPPVMHMDPVVPAPTMHASATDTSLPAAWRVAARQAAEAATRAAAATDTEEWQDEAEEEQSRMAGTAFRTRNRAPSRHEYSPENAQRRSAAATPTPVPAANAVSSPPWRANALLFRGQTPSSSSGAKPMSTTSHASPRVFQPSPPARTPRQRSPTVQSYHSGVTTPLRHTHPLLSSDLSSIPRSDDAHPSPSTCMSTPVTHRSNAHVQHPPQNAPSHMRIVSQSESQALRQLRRQHEHAHPFQAQSDASTSAIPPPPKLQLDSAIDSAPHIFNSTGQRMEAADVAVARRLLQRTLAAAAKRSGNNSNAHQTHPPAHSPLNGAPVERGVNAHPSDRPSDAMSRSSLYAHVMGDSAFQPSAHVSASTASSPPVSARRKAALQSLVSPLRSLPPGAETTGTGTPRKLVSARQPAASKVVQLATPRVPEEELHDVLSVVASRASLLDASNDAAQLSGSSSFRDAAATPLSPALSMASLRFRRPPAHQKRALARLDNHYCHSLTNAGGQLAANASELTGDALQVSTLERAHMERSSRAFLAQLSASQHAIKQAHIDSLDVADAEHRHSAIEGVHMPFAEAEALLARRVQELEVQRVEMVNSHVAALAQQREEQTLAELAALAQEQHQEQLLALESKLAARAHATQDRWAEEWERAARDKQDAVEREQRNALLKQQEISKYRAAQYERKRLSARAGVLWVRVIRASQLGEETPVTTANPGASSKSSGVATPIPSSPQPSSPAAPLSLLPVHTSSCVAISLRFKAASLSNHTCFTRHFGRDSNPHIEEVFRMHVHNAALQTLFVTVHTSPARQVEVWERELRLALSYAAQVDADHAEKQTQLEMLAAQGLLCVRSALIKDPVHLTGAAAASSSSSAAGSAMSSPLPNRRRVSFAPHTHGRVTSPGRRQTMRVQTQEVKSPEGGASPVQGDGEEKQLVLPFLTQATGSSSPTSPNDAIVSSAQTRSPRPPSHRASTDAAPGRRSPRIPGRAHASGASTHDDSSPSTEVLISSISSQALARLTSHARLRDRSEHITRVEEAGQAHISLAALRAQSQGFMRRELPLRMQISEQRKKEREVRRQWAKRASISMDPADTGAIVSPFLPPSAPFSSHSRPTPPRSMPGHEIIQCGNVLVELLLLPTFGSAVAAGQSHAGSSSASNGSNSANHERQQTGVARTAATRPHPSSNGRSISHALSHPLRIGRHELSGEEQRRIELDIEAEAELAAAALTMPDLMAKEERDATDAHMDGRDEQSHMHAVTGGAASVPAAGVRVQLTPTLHARALQVATLQPSSTSASAAL